MSPNSFVDYVGNANALSYDSDVFIHCAPPCIYASLAVPVLVKVVDAVTNNLFASACVSVRKGINILYSEVLKSQSSSDAFSLFPGCYTFFSTGSDCNSNSTSLFKEGSTTYCVLDSAADPAPIITVPIIGRNVLPDQVRKALY